MYSLMIFIGVIAYALVTIWLVEKREKTKRDEVTQLLVVSAAGFAVLGLSAYLFNALFHSIEERRLVFGGITWLGGVIGGFPAMVLLIHKYCPRFKGNALKYFDLLIPGIVLAHGFGRLGCFFGGCCFGAQTDSFLGVIFPEGSLAALKYPAPDGRSLPVYPTQLFESAFEFLLFGAMIIFYKKLRGHFLETYAFAYGAFRFALEFMRGDDRGATILFLTPSQWMSIVLITAGVLLILYSRGIIFKKLQEKTALWREEAKAYVPPRRTSRDIKILRELKELKDEGVITEEEFEAKKQEILARL
ncbi:MAG: prolipoprotein diacylglyceryl transferase [Clostridia bacterium]|nr:prolipoprotein diacylglyceryl transferase [Clostridia bacterium]